MIDVHSHIVFGVDDGSKNIEQSIQIIKEGYEAGFKTIIATPHYMVDAYEVNKEEIANRINELEERLQEENCPVQILQGNEIYITENINELLELNKAVTLCDSKYVLFELPLNAEVMNLNQIIYQILEKNRVPILAHPERYPFVKKNPKALFELAENGVLFQCNYGSAIGQYGHDAKKTLKKLLKYNLVSLFGSDVHRPNTIYPNIDEALEKIKKLIGEEKLYELTTLNPEKIINNQDIDDDFDEDMDYDDIDYEDE